MATDGRLANLSITCGECSMSLAVIVEADGRLREGGEPPLEGGLHHVAVSGASSDEDELPVRREYFCETVNGWKEELEELLKKGIIPKQALKDLIVKMDKALGDDMEVVSSGERTLSVELLDHDL